MKKQTLKLAHSELLSTMTQAPLTEPLSGMRQVRKYISLSPHVWIGLRRAVAGGYRSRDRFSEFISSMSQLLGVKRQRTLMHYAGRGHGRHASN